MSAETLTGPWFDNEPMGQRTRIIMLPAETGGRYFIRDYTNRPFTGKYAIPAHFHPRWTETFEIRHGHARYRLGKQEFEAEPGESIVLPPGVAHLHPWSVSNEELYVRHTAVADPSDLEGLTAGLQAILTIFALATQGRVNRRGVPTPLQLAVLAEAAMPATYVPGAPPAVQKVLIRAAATLGRAVGYRVTYPGFPTIPPG